MSRTINELNTTDTLADADKFVIWQDTSQATRAITAENMADYFGLGGQSYELVDTYEALKAIPAGSRTNGQTVYVKVRETVGDYGGGLFRWTFGNLSAAVTSDPRSGIFVAADDEISGISGAWVRQITDDTLWVEWFGAKTNNAWPPTYPHTVWDTAA
jgi:hypothetical protein